MNDLRSAGVAVIVYTILHFVPKLYKRYYRFISPQKWKLMEDAMKKRNKQGIDTLMQAAKESYENTLRLYKKYPIDHK